MPQPAAPAAIFNLTGKVAVVTGASGGLGARFAQVLIAAGAEVVAGARRRDRLEALSAADDSGRLHVRELDVTSAASRTAFINAALARGGHIDVLVNNAGISGYAAAEDEDLASWRAAFDVNVDGLFAMTQLAARPMLARGAGSIVNLASILGFVASSPFNTASYVATKGAVVSLTRELAVQWARQGVRVNALAPGWFRTEMNEAAVSAPGVMAYQRRNCPMGRWGGIDELDGAILFLASDASSYCTGQVLVIDGGWTAR